MSSRISLCLILVVLLSSCATYNKFEIENLYPAEFTMPNNVKRMAIVKENNYVLNDFSLNGKEYVLDAKSTFLDSLAYNTTLESVMAMAAYSPLTRRVRLAYEQFDREETLKIPRWEDWERKKYILKYDVIGSLDYFSGELKVKKIYNDYGEGDILIGENIECFYEVSAIFNLYDLRKKEILGQKLIRDTLYLTMPEELHGVIDLGTIANYTFLEAGKYLGEKIGRYMFPIWEKEQRIIYKHGNEAMRKAAKRFSEDSFEEAEKIWKEQIRNLDPYISSKAYYNLAVLYETRGNYRQAFSFASRSSELINNSELRNYMQYLSKRVRNQNRIQEQVQ